MLSEAAKHRANYCTFCPKMCHFACPVAEAEKDESLTPWGKQQTARLVDQGALPLKEETALPAYKCLTCRASESFCEHKILLTDSIQEMREKAVEAQVAPSEIFLFLKKFQHFSNPYGRDLEERLIKKAGPAWFDPKKPVLFFPTCHTLALQGSAMGEYLRLFEKLKIKNLRLMNGSLQCCGHALWVLGFRNEFRELAEVQYHALKAAEFIVVGSPECAWTLREVYPRFHFPLKAKVLTLLEYVANFLEHFSFRSKPKTRQRFFYHDACYLGRYLGDYEEPRRLLKMVTGFRPEEFSWCREQGLCSGSGGGYPLISPEGSRKIAERHLEEILKKDIRTLVTGCPQAAERFRSLGHKLVVKDLVAFLGENLLVGGK